MDQRVSWRETFRWMREDRARAREHLRARFGFSPLIVSLHPVCLSVLLHRTAHAFWTRRLRLPARLVAQINQWITGFDAHPHSSIGPGALILAPTGSSISGHSGARLTMGASSGLGFIPGEKDVGGGPGHPVIADGLTLASKSGVLGPYRVGRNVRVTSGVACMCDADDEGLVRSIVAYTPDATPSPSPPPASRPGAIEWSCPHRSLRALSQSLAADARRYLGHDSDNTPAATPGLLRTLVICTTIPMMVTIVHRFSHFLHANGMRRSAHALAAVNRLVNKATIPPTTCVGPGLFLPHPVGAVLHCRAGRGLTLYARSVIAPAGDPAIASIVEAPVLGDRVTVSAQTVILGPAHLGSNVSLSINAATSQDIPPSTLVFDTRLRTEVVHASDPAAVPQISRSDVPPLPRSVTRQRRRDDLARVRENLGERASWLRIRLHPSSICSLLHRLSRHHRGHGRLRLAHWLWRINLLLTGADIDPTSDIGGGLLIPMPAGVSLDADAGRNLTIGAIAAVNRGFAEARPDLDPDARPRLGDNVTIDAHAGACGKITVGSGAHILPTVVAITDVPDGARLAPPPPRLVRLRGSRAAPAASPA